MAIGVEGRLVRVEVYRAHNACCACMELSENKFSKNYM